MIYILRLLIISIIYIFFYRESFIAELTISFVPYIIWFCILVLIIEIYLIIKESIRSRKNKTPKIFFKIILTILTIWILTLYSYEYFWFYNQSDSSIRLKDDNWIKVFYANILYKNTDYQSLQEKIEIEDPDIVILVEFSDDHEDEMKQFFKERYPYMNRNSRSSMLAWDVVFSKIPLNDVKTQWLQWKGTRKYSYMQVWCSNYTSCDKDVDLYVIHTSAPVSIENFEMRNNQIQQLKSDFLLKWIKWNPVMVIWDFNLSPWSYYYKDLTKNRWLNNALSYQSPNYTRTFLQHWIFLSHIDQLFITNNIKISPITIENLTWSDHRSFTFNFWTKDSL